MSVRDAATGMLEATIVINGRTLTFAESMTLRVAISNFLLMLGDQEFRNALGPIGEHYDHHLTQIEQYLRNKS